MKNKGFTLVEVMGVIVVLAILVVVAVPAIMTLMKNNENAEYDIMISDIKHAAELYISLYPEQFLNFTEGQTVTITVGQLQEAELLKVNLINPKTGEQVPATAGINVTNRLGENEIVIDFDREGEVGGYTFVKDFEYTGSAQEFTVPETGYYKIELWGAQGLTSVSLGGYTSGIIQLQKNEKLYFYVGQGLASVNPSFNGGSGDNGGYPGGGATDVRFYVNPTTKAWNDSTSLRSRIMVAGGSGSGSGNSATTYGAGGGIIGRNGKSATGALQHAPGARDSTSYAASAFGIGNGGCAGGGGYFGGGGAGCATGGGGGSSFISGYAGANAIEETGGTAAQPLMTNNTKHYSGKYFIDGNMRQGVNAGNGKAKITYVSKSVPTRVNTKLNNVRYIKSCASGDSANGAAAKWVHWIELQTIKDGLNVARKPEVVLSSNFTPAAAISRLNDASTVTTEYTYISGLDLACVTMDLGKTYNLDEIALWFYWIDGRTFYKNTLSVGPTNVSGIDPLSTILHTYTGTDGYSETVNGRRYNAWNLEAID